MFKHDQITIPCVIMRSGTSKGIYLHEKDLPKDVLLRNKVILSIFGSSDPRQIDGLGSADVLTSKLAIVGPSDRNDADVDYTFGQVVIDRPMIQFAGLCGNISAGVAPYAIEQGIVSAKEPCTTVRIFNTNTQQIFETTVPVENGKPRVLGDYSISGVPGAGARLDINMVKTAGSATGKLLPTDSPRNTLVLENREVDVSIVDVVNPCVFVCAADIGMTGVEAPPDMNRHEKTLDMLEGIRKKAAGLIGFSTNQKDLDADSRPMIVVVSPAQNHSNFLTGELISQNDHDFAARCFMISGATRDMHQAFPGSISVATAVASRIPGTIVNEVSRSKGLGGIVRIGHPLGSLNVDVQVSKEGKLQKASYSRTARRIMDGNVYIPRSILD